MSINVTQKTELKGKYVKGFLLKNFHVSAVQVEEVNVPTHRTLQAHELRDIAAEFNELAEILEASEVVDILTDDKIPQQNQHSTKLTTTYWQHKKDQLTGKKP